MLPSEGLVDDITEMDATAVLSADGEVLPLAEKVSCSPVITLSFEAVCLIYFL